MIMVIFFCCKSLSGNKLRLVFIILDCNCQLLQVFAVQRVTKSLINSLRFIFTLTFWSKWRGLSSKKVKNIYIERIPRLSNISNLSSHGARIPQIGMYQSFLKPPIARIPLPGLGNALCGGGFTYLIDT